MVIKALQIESAFRYQTPHFVYIRWSTCYQTEQSAKVLDQQFPIPHIELQPLKDWWQVHRSRASLIGSCDAGGFVQQFQRVEC